MDATQPDPHLGAAVGNLVLVAHLGTGGMGTVYRAEHRALGTPSAANVLHPRFSESPETIERFRREAVACSDHLSEDMQLKLSNLKAEARRQLEGPPGTGDSPGPPFSC